MLTLNEIKGVGAATVKKLEELDIKSVFELLSFLPSKYIDLESPVSVCDAEAGQLALFEGTVERVSALSKRGKRSFYVTFKDSLAKGRIFFKAIFFNMPFLHAGFEAGQSYRLLAKLGKDEGAYVVVNPQLEKSEKISKLNGVYTVYPLRGVIGQNAFKNIIYSALDSMKGMAYQGKLGRINADMAECFENIHRPPSAADAFEARERLASLDIAIVLSLYKKLHDNSQKQRKVFYKSTNSAILDYASALPFALTPSQLAACEDIAKSLSADVCMSRIVSGDVGSGKTAVAFFAMYLAAISGRQSVMMAPTEILVNQHARSFESVAKKLGLSFVCITASLSAIERADALAKIESGEVDCVFGTQALISEGVNYKSLSLAVIDEQHRFGVNERRQLENKGACDILSLTATPIPRSMALTFYEDIEISRIFRRTEGMSNISTKILSSVEETVALVCEACRRGEQAFVVCPSIKDAEGYDAMSIEGFMREHGASFDGISVGVLHGRLSAEEKSRVMRDFADGRLSALIATSVVEVGVDTRASVMAVLSADRFGLASLHQLRGRVGRDGRPAICYFQSNRHSKGADIRLEALEHINDGQELAELDFAMRGAGDFLGTRQSGASLTPMFGLCMNKKILLSAKEYSENCLSDLSVLELTALTRRSEQRVKAFLDGLEKVTLNS